MNNNNLNDFYRLLAGRKRLTIQEKETILDAVVSEHAKESDRPFWESVKTPRFVRIAVVAGLLFISIPVIFMMRSNGAEDGQYEAKGGNGNPFVALKCLDSDELGSCKRGETLTFKVLPPHGKQYLSLFAKHRGSGKVVWYVPSRDNGTSEKVRADSVSVLDTGIVIGNEHEPGAYEVTAVFSVTRQKRADIRSLFNNDSDSGPNEHDYILIHAGLMVQ